MFAVIKTGGKQYKVSAGTRLTVEKLAAEAGDTVQFNDVLMLGGDGGPTVGAPFVKDAGVQAEVVDQTRGPKTISFKRRRRKHSSARRKGHRQDLTLVRITEILGSGAGASGVAAAVGAGSAAAPAEKPAKKAAPKKKAAPTPKKTALEPKKVEKTPAEKAPAAGESRPGNLLDAPRGEADDLTRISGVGPKLREKLNANGVHHFWQIAEWGPAEIAFMDDHLSFKGRIARDEWVKQAAEFAAEAKT